MKNYKLDPFFITLLGTMGAYFTLRVIPTEVGWYFTIALFYLALFAQIAQFIQVDD